MPEIILLIWRVDYDPMENREPVHRTLLGFCRDTAEARAVVTALRAKATRYQVREHGSGGMPSVYPKFDVVPVTELSKEQV